LEGCADDYCVASLAVQTSDKVDNMNLTARKTAFARPAFGGLGPKLIGSAFIAGAYLLLNAAASNERRTGDATGQIGDGLAHNLMSSAASMLPMLLLIAGLQSVMVLNHHRDVTATGFASAAFVPTLSETDVERVLGAHYLDLGYAVIENRGHDHDGGVDLVLHSHDEKIYAQCRHWKDSVIGAEVIIDLERSMRREGATSGIIVSSGRFSPTAEAAAGRAAIRLLDSGAVARLMQTV
jgi:restriction system protein